MSDIIYHWSDLGKKLFFWDFVCVCTLKYNLHTVKFTFSMNSTSCDNSNQDKERFNVSKYILEPLVVNPFPHTLLLKTAGLISFYMFIFHCPECSKGDHIVCSFCVWFLSLGIIIFRFIQIVACITVYSLLLLSKNSLQITFNLSS